MCLMQFYCSLFESHLNSRVVAYCGLTCKYSCCFILLENAFDFNQHKSVVRGALSKLKKLSPYCDKTFFVKIKLFLTLTVFWTWEHIFSK